MSQPLERPLHTSRPHADATLHVTGAARYVDDLPEPPGLLHACLVPATVAAGRLVRVDVEAARAVPGVIDVVTAADLPGDPLIGPITHDEPVLASDRIDFHGQNVAVVYAETRAAAARGAAAVGVTVEATEPVLTIEAAIARGDFLTSPHTIARGDVDQALDDAPHRLTAVVSPGAQDHFYLETQGAMAAPDEDGRITIWSSTQHPTEIQRMAAHVCQVPESWVTCKVPRMGGGFGGKESQATNYGVLACLGVLRTGRPVKLVLDRDQDMRFTGKRHAFRGEIEVGFDDEGKLLALDARLYSDGGWCADLSGPVMDRAVFHIDGSYQVDHLRVVGRVCRTNKTSATAFRGFGGPQGVLVVEEALNQVAEVLSLDPALVRRRNLYQEGARTHFGQQLVDVRLERIADELLESSNYSARREAIDAFNARSRWVKRGIGFMPVKFGISFTAGLLNQAGALVLVYADGSVQLNHGGTEMGQGLHTKMRAVAADVLGVNTDDVRVMTTSTDKVPNTSATAASSGSDLNGQAVRLACEAVRERMREVAAELLEAAPADVSFEGGQVGAGARSLGFAELARTCWARRVSLSSTGFYATPGIQYDAEAGRGTPFFYFAYGGAVVEVEVDGRTGQHGLRRVDVLHDVGRSLVPSIDKGQVEGAFVQGWGWLTVEEVLHDAAGRLLTHGPSTYKIPAVGDVPHDFHVSLLPRADQAGVIGGSKAVGEPPFLLAIGTLAALRQAIRAFGTPTEPLQLALPATNENVLRAVTAVRG